MYVGIHIFMYFFTIVPDGGSRIIRNMQHSRSMLLNLFSLTEPPKSYRTHWGTPTSPDYVKCKIKSRHMFNYFVPYVQKIDDQLQTDRYLDRFAWYIVCLWLAVLIELTAESGSFWIEEAVDCLGAISDGVISIECPHINFNWYIQI